MPVKIIGTSHISEESIKKVKRLIEETKPDCVAIELDPKRFFALAQQREGSGRKIGLRYGLTIYFFGWLQQALGKSAGVLPGSEMLAAAEAARQTGARVVLIDRDIEEIIRGMMAVPLKEKLKLFFGLFAIPFSREKINLGEVPQERIVEQAVRYMKKELPEFYKILVADRNEYMAAWIKRLEGEFENIVVVVGAGHRKELERMIRRK